MPRRRKSSPSRAVKSLSNVATVIPKELNFPKQLGASVTRTVKVKNNASNKSLAFKLQCNAPTRYAVTPASGVIKPASEQLISVRLKALESVEFENSDNDKFLVRVTQIGAQEYDFSSENWASAPKSAVMKYLVKVAFHTSSSYDDSKYDEVASDPMKMSRNQIPTNNTKQLWTPHANNSNNNNNKNNKMSRFSTPMAPEMTNSSSGQVKQAAQGLKKIWSERAIRKRGSDDSPQAANRYDNAVATVENVTALVTSDDNNNEARVIELLMKDGSRKEEHKLSKEELHELIGYRGKVSDDIWQQWVAKAQAHREKNIEMPQQHNIASTPFSVSRNNNFNNNRQVQSVGKVRTAKRFQIRKAPQSVKPKRNFVGATRRNTYIGQHNAPVNTKYPPTQQRYNQLESKSYTGDSNNRPPWEGVQGMNNPGITRSSVLRKVLTRKPDARTGVSTAKKASIVREYMENGGDLRKHSLRKKTVKFGYGIVARAESNGNRGNIRVGSSLKKSARQKQRKNVQRNVNKFPTRNMTALTPTEKSLLEKVVNYEARLDAVESERSAMMSKIEQIEKKTEVGDKSSSLFSQSTITKAKTSNASLSLADLTEINPHDLTKSSTSNNNKSTNNQNGEARDIYTFEAEFDTPLGIVIGSRRIIKTVNINSAAMEKGLEQGDIILGVNGEEIPEAMSPQDVSSIISHKRDNFGFARLYLLRNRNNAINENIIKDSIEAENVTPSISATISPAVLEHKNNDEELDQARKKIVFLETQLELLNNADNTWKHKESLKKELNKCKSENKELKEKCKMLERDILYLAGQLRGYSGRSGVVPEQVRNQFTQLRESMSNTSEAVETIFAQVSRDLTIFSQHIMARANTDLLENTNSTNVLSSNYKSRSIPMLNSQIGKNREIRNVSRHFVGGNVRKGNSAVAVVCVPRCEENMNDFNDNVVEGIVNVVNENSVVLNFGATPKQFIFSRALPTNSNGEEVVKSDIYDKIENVCNGRSVCLFVHGDASSRNVCPLLYGKDDMDLGIMRTAVKKLFDNLNETDENIALSVTAVECLNNQFRDLLQPPSESPESHELHRDGEGNVWVSNVVGVELKSIDDFTRVADICRGRQSLLTSKGKFIIPRRDSQTYLNRGCIPHPDANIVITIQLDAINNDLSGGDGESSIALSKLTFVNLATGSNVANQATLTGVGDVLENIAANNEFIPYRHAKLTRMLEPSLPKGNVDVVLILSVSTAEEDVIETNRSLLFGRKLCEKGGGAM